MSDVSQGPGWWQASDGKWYSPEQRPASEPPAPAPAAGYPSTAPRTSPFGPLADWVTRVLATLIDAAASAAVAIAGVIVTVIISAISTTLGLLVGFVIYLGASALGLYFAYMNGALGQSPGKKVMGIKVISEETGQVIGGGLGIVRSLAHVVDAIICYVGFLFPLWDPKRQTLADKIMKTVVISGLPKQPVGPELLKAQ